ncbi:MAG: sigma-70 family RNA polymerase sigma factor [Planctomycetaceae bacterium]
MSDMTDDVIELLCQARGGNQEALGKLLEQHRSYLKVIALRFLDGPLAARVDASDVVQQTCLSVFRNFGRFAGERPGEFVAWLKEIHEKNLTDAYREHVVAQKRSLSREDSPIVDVAPATATTSSPSQRLLADEQAVILTRAMAELPEEQAEAVRLRFLEGLSMQEIATRMERTVDSIVGLIRRGITGLKGKLDSQG